MNQKFSYHQIFYLNAFLSLNRNSKAVFITQSNYNYIPKFWKDYPHLILTPVEIGLKVEFPRCEK